MAQNFDRGNIDGLDLFDRKILRDSLLENLYLLSIKSVNTSPVKILCCTVMH